ncbi:MAG: glycosyltransferase family 4 protein [Thermoplasmata archaeon]|nr:glycosyltransferase family 4 protein [Thermoplasmata archaeon]
MARRTRVLLIRPTESPFMQLDEELLRRHHDVRTLDMHRVGRPFYTLRFLARLKLGLLWADACVTWFADKPAYAASRVARFFRTPTVVIVGGYEVAKEPEIGYGGLLNPKEARTVRKAIEGSDLVLAVSEFTKVEIEKNLGFKAARVLHNCVRDGLGDPSVPKEPIVLMVANALAKTRKLKGLDCFAKASSLVPEARFVLVGRTDEATAGELKALGPRLEVVGELPYDEMVSWMRRAKVCCQLSYRESFGVAVLEAMACGCVPVVTRAGALPEVVGEAGQSVDYDDVEGTVKAIRSSLKADGKAATERSRMFSAERREKGLVDAIEAVLREK